MSTSWVQITKLRHHSTSVDVISGLYHCALCTDNVSVGTYGVLHDRTCQLLCFRMSYNLNVNINIYIKYIEREEREKSVAIGER